MAFADTLRTLPFTPQTPNGRGFIPPMLRASVHTLFLAACLADENVTVSTEEALDELRHAQTHWTARTDTTAVSTATRERATTIQTALTEAIAEFEGWDENTRINNIRDLGHRIAQFTADLDREVVGLTDSDAGTSL
jgi:hypothetical protein